MKAWAWSGAVALVGLLAGCNQQQLPIAARLGGAHDMVRSGNLLLITSSDRDELRALDLVIDEDQTTRDFVRAPNPLEALSIPVLDFPIALARDQDPELLDKYPSRYVYARSDGLPAISIVLAQDELDLREVRRFFTEAPVTAIAARAPPRPSPPSTESTAPSVLYYATWNGAQAVLWRLEVPRPELLDVTENPPPLVPERITAIGGTLVKSLLVLPPENEIALTLATPTSTEPWFGWVLDTETLDRRQLQFPSQVKKLYTNPGRLGEAPTEEDPAPLPSLAPGAWIYGLLDDLTCMEAARVGAVRSCPGIFVVNATTGAEVLDIDGNRMVLDLNGAFPMGLSIQPNAPLRLPDGSQGVTAFLGIVTTSGSGPEPSGGQIHFFHAQRLRAFDMDGTHPTATAVYLSANGNQRTFVPGPVLAENTSVSTGQTRNDTVQIVFQGLIPGLTDVARGAGQTQFVVPFLDRLAAGDVAVLGPQDAPCGAPIPIDLVGTDPPNNVRFTAPVPPECETERSFSIRAAGTLPYVVGSIVTGYMGRTGPNQPFVFDARVYFERPAGDPSGDHYLSFFFGAGDPAIQQDDRYLITLTSGYLPYTFWPDPTVFTGYYLPTAVVNYVSEVDPAVRDDKDIPAAFVAYPSAPGVIEINPSLAVPGVPNTTTTFIEHR